MARTEAVQLDLEQQKGAWIFTASLLGAPLAVMQAVPHGAHVIIHLDVRQWSRGLYREYLVCFEAIRQFFREDGRGLLFVCSDRCDEKMKRFWWLMGFRVFGEIDQQGKRIPYAVMEA